MSDLKKIVEKPVTQEELEKLKWLYKGLDIIAEKGKEIALEKQLGEDKETISPEEFHSIASSKELEMPDAYRKELDRYQKLFVDKVSDILEVNEIKGSEIGQKLGIPAAKEHLFELKKEGKRLGFVHLKHDDKTMDLLLDVKDIPNEFKEKIKEG